MPTTQEQLPSSCRHMSMDGLYADNAGRLHGSRRYASMDGCGRTASGTAVERPLKRILRSRHLHILVQHNAGAVAEQLSAYAMDGLYADNAGRLHGCRRYASMDGCGRTASGTAVERPLKRILRSRHLHILVQHNAGAVAEQLQAMPRCRQAALVRTQTAPCACCREPGFPCADADRRPRSRPAQEGVSCPRVSLNTITIDIVRAISYVPWAVALAWLPQASQPAPAPQRRICKPGHHPIWSSTCFVQFHCLLSP